MIINSSDINLEDTLTCGQLFRYFKCDDDSYDIVLKDRVINVKQDKNTLIIESNNNDNLEEVIYNYFDLNCDYNSIGKNLIDIDEKLKESVENSKGLKMLRQDPFEMVISYIISANNKVERIARSVNLLCMKYGEKVSFKNKDYYMFPSIDSLKDLTVQDFNELKIGFRDKYVYDAIYKIKNNIVDLNKINDLNSNDALNYLMQINGIGPKVASCILLFGYNRFDVFPVDTWAIKQIHELHNEIANNQKSVIEFAKNKYGNYSAIALQYMFHNSRNKKN